MTRILPPLILSVLLISISGLSSAAETLDIVLKPMFELGRNEYLFGEIAAVCEDGTGHIYVADRLEHRVTKYSSEGRLLGTFGRKGQGPGDLQYPSRISWTPAGELAVADEMYFISFFSEDGSFLRRLHLNGRLAPGYIGEDRFYGWSWTPEGRQQVMVNAASEIVQSFHTQSRDVFSLSIPDESGRAVMFNYGRPAFTPGLVYANAGGHTAIASSGNYEISILDGRGRTVATCARDVPPDVLSEADKDQFGAEFRALGKQRGWPESVIRRIVRSLPDKKTYFDQVLLNRTHVFVFRIPENIFGDLPDIPMDIFSLAGEYQGTALLKEKPVFLSDRRMCVVRSDEDGNQVLAVMEYAWK